MKRLYRAASLRQFAVVPAASISAETPFTLRTVLDRNGAIIPGSPTPFPDDIAHIVRPTSPPPAGPLPARRPHAHAALSVNHDLVLGAARLAEGGVFQRFRMNAAGASGACHAMTTWTFAQEARDLPARPHPSCWISEAQRSRPVFSPSFEEYSSHSGANVRLPRRPSVHGFRHSVHLAHSVSNGLYFAYL